jgi:hypothetical protein
MTILVLLEDNIIVDNVGLQIQYELHQNGVISMDPYKTLTPIPPPKACTSL